MAERPSGEQTVPLQPIRLEGRPSTREIVPCCRFSLFKIVANAWHQKVLRTPIDSNYELYDYKSDLEILCGVEVVRVSAKILDIKISITY